MAYAALTSARLGHRSAALVGADGIAAQADELELLRSAGVTVQIMPLRRGPIFENLETAHGRVQTCIEPGDPLPVVELNPAWADAPAWLVVPVAGETGPEWAAAIPSGARLALGWQGLLRTLIAGERTGRRAPTRGPLVDRADLIGVSRADLAPETSLDGLNAVLRPGARLVVTNGAAGGLSLDAGNRGPTNELTYAAVPSRQVDPTGAGDVFLAALVAAWLDRAAPQDQPASTGADLRWAAAASALVVEGVGLPAVPDRASVAARLAATG